MAEISKCLKRSILCVDMSGTESNSDITLFSRILGVSVSRSLSDEEDAQIFTLIIARRCSWT